MSTPPPAQPSLDAITDPASYADACAAYDGDKPTAQLFHAPLEHLLDNDVHLEARATSLERTVEASSIGALVSFTPVSSGFRRVKP